MKSEAKAFAQEKGLQGNLPIRANCTQVTWQLNHRLLVLSSSHVLAKKTRKKTSR